MDDNAPSTSGGGGSGGAQRAATKGHKKKKSRKKKGEGGEVVCTWQCVAMSLIMLCLPTILALRAMHMHTDSLVRNHQSQSILYNATIRGALPGSGSAGGVDWHHITVADLICYANRYEDIQAMHGFDPTALLRHYIEYGQKEGRDPFCERLPAGAPPQQVLPPQPFAAPTGSAAMLVDISCDESSGKDPNTCRIRCTDSACSNAQSLCEILPRCISVSLSGNRAFGLLKGHADDEDLKQGGKPYNADLDLSTYDYIQQARRGYAASKEYYAQQRDAHSIKRMNAIKQNSEQPKKKKKKWGKPGTDEFVDPGDLPFDPMGPLRGVNFEDAASLDNGKSPGEPGGSVWSSGAPGWQDFSRPPGQLQGDIGGAPPTGSDTFPPLPGTPPNPASWGLPTFNGKSDAPEEGLRANRPKYPRSQLSARAVGLGRATPPPPPPLLPPPQPPPPPLPPSPGSPSQQIERVLPVTERWPRGKCATSPLMGGKDSCLPAFLIIGAQKSGIFLFFFFLSSDFVRFFLTCLFSVLVIGTSTLAHLMGQHPQVKNPRVKELLFFNWNNDFKIKCKPKAAELRIYFSDFPKISQSQFQQSGIVSGEWSATYVLAKILGSY